MSINNDLEFEFCNSTKIMWYFLTFVLCHMTYNIDYFIVIDRFMLEQGIIIMVEIGNITISETSELWDFYKQLPGKYWRMVYRVMKLIIIYLFSNRELSYLLQIAEKQHDLKKKLKVNFVGEPGLDMGGLTKEWFLLLLRQIFHSDYGECIINDVVND